MKNTNVKTIKFCDAKDLFQCENVNKLTFYPPSEFQGPFNGLQCVFGLIVFIMSCTPPKKPYFAEPLISKAYWGSSIRETQHVAV